MSDQIYLSPPHMGTLELQYVEQAFASNWLAPVGPHLDQFEKELCTYVDQSAALALNSGTSALHMALKLADIRPGDYVLCSSLTFAASANPIVYQGGIPVFVDCEPESWNMSPDALQAACEMVLNLGHRPKAVVIVHLYGHSARMDELMKICEHYELIVIEDAAEALGTKYKGRSCGTMGRFGIYSFNGNKLITTTAGGMLVSANKEDIEKAKYWATQAKSPRPYYHHIEIGFNYRMSNVLAGIGRGQLAVIESRIQARRSIHQRYKQSLANIPGVQFLDESQDERATHWLSVVLLDREVTGVTPEEMMAALAEDHIESRRVWKPLHMQPVYQDCLYVPHHREFSVSEKWFKEGLCLPSGSCLSAEEQERVIERIYTRLQARSSVIHS
ncbi:aminotransferase class I/II-fold pyridoxal phosphate-dependent enzyme [Paenibacillus terrigena]|uniref:DegT/DnrJ/EryC1/StrS family aminotransferase n=1 Tax=Paenibacillus terrigena TaxID=369333 RepID=UPI0028D09B2C|nr:aminotransferase class I/II-fold pyridoxal phosphate-dependent enzyme [Paenibacillus terrigena]